MNKNAKELSITSPSRLHLGFYGFDDSYGYKYGSMGLDACGLLLIWIMTPAPAGAVFKKIHF